MKIRSIQLHNFRSVKDLSCALDDYCLLVGENNTGKTALLTAVRIFYEEGGAKFSREIDFPKFPTDDNESWIEIAYRTTEEEQETLKTEYRSADRLLRVRRYFQSDNKDLVKANQSNIYGYEKGTLSTSLFYGAKNVSQAKLGSVLYIPEVNRSDDALKLSGPSPFRDMVNFVMKRAVVDSRSFGDLNTAFTTFNEKFKEEASADGFSVNSLIEEINRELGHWKIRFGVDVNPLRPEDIVKTLLTHFIEDENLEGKRVSLGSYGQGLQRHLIYTLIRLSARFVEPRAEKKKEFAPDFTLILFEEPEAFLHPSQQERLNASLRSLAAEATQQILITTHSPGFVSKQVSKLTTIIRLQKTAAVTEHFQLSEEQLARMLDRNRGLYQRFSDMLQDPGVSEPLKREIRRRGLGEDSPEEDPGLEDEATRSLLWLNAERAALFFARHVVLCEGPTEKAMFEYLIDTVWRDLGDRNLYFADALGKFNIHRHMALLSGLGIRHSVLFDRDRDAGIHDVVNSFIGENRTDLTIQIESFPSCLEDFLGIARAKRRDLKPLHVISKLLNNAVTADKITELRHMVDRLLGG
jgi:predicted ATP-dependent endonuclease of OLD family